MEIKKKLTKSMQEKLVSLTPKFRKIKKALDIFAKMPKVDRSDNEEIAGTLRFLYENFKKSDAVNQYALKSSTKEPKSVTNQILTEINECCEDLNAACEPNKFTTDECKEMLAKITKLYEYLDYSKLIRKINDLKGDNKYDKGYATIEHPKLKNCLFRFRGNLKMCEDTIKKNLEKKSLELNKLKPPSRPAPKPPVKPEFVPQRPSRPAPKPPVKSKSVPPPLPPRNEPNTGNRRPSMPPLGPITQFNNRAMSGANSMNNPPELNLPPAP